MAKNPGPIVAGTTPAPNSGSGLTDMVQQVSGGFGDRVAQAGDPQAASMDLVSQLIEMQSQQAQLQQNQDQMLAMPMMSPSTEVPQSVPGQSPLIPTLLALLGGGIAAATGSGQGLEAAATGLETYLAAKKAKEDDWMQGQMNAVEQETARAESYNKHLRHQQDTAIELNTQAMNALDKKRQRLLSLMQTNLDAFVDPDTGKPVVDPRLLMWGATGYRIPINPLAKRELDQRTSRQEKMIEMGIDWINDADTPMQRVAGLSLIGRAMDVEWSDEMYKLAETGNEREVWLQLLTDDTFTGDSVMFAWSRAILEGKSVHEVVGSLVKTPPEAGDKIDTIPKAELAAMGELAKRIQANPVLQDPDLSFNELVMEAFPDQVDVQNRTLLLDRWGAEGVSAELVANQMRSSMATIMTLNEFIQGGVPQKYLDPYGISREDPDWVAKLAIAHTQHIAPALSGLEQQAADKSITGLRSELEASLLERRAGDDTLPGSPILQKFTPRQIRAFALKTVLEMRSDSDTASGLFDYNAFLAKVEAFKNDPRAWTDPLNAMFPGVLNAPSEEGQQ